MNRSIDPDTDLVAPDFVSGANGDHACCPFPHKGSDPTRNFYLWYEILAYEVDPPTVRAKLSCGHTVIIPSNLTE